MKFFYLICVLVFLVSCDKKSGDKDPYFTIQELVQYNGYTLERFDKEIKKRGYLFKEKREKSIDEGMVIEYSYEYPKHFKGNSEVYTSIHKNIGKFSPITYVFYITSDHQHYQTLVDELPEQKFEYTDLDTRSGLATRIFKKGTQKVTVTASAPEINQVFVFNIRKD